MSALQRFYGIFVWRYRGCSGARDGVRKNTKSLHFGGGCLVRSDCSFRNRSKEKEEDWRILSRRKVSVCADFLLLVYKKLYNKNIDKVIFLIRKEKS